MPLAPALASAAPRPPCETVSVEVAAARLGLSRSKAYELARTVGTIGGIPVLRFGRKLVVPCRALDRVLLVDQPVPNVTA